ncbi:hypothetical protein KSP39_PZI012367 [Platanthera zijinensis]|uniref:Uncharacterized protein n=1 Tax=Platanthera zijinensis TaxID=2320716 RepID=A0AAP0G4A5_9ASPA
MIYIRNQTLAGFRVCVSQSISCSIECNTIRPSFDSRLCTPRHAIYHQSSCISARPNRVYVTSILIVTVKIYCNIQDHGVWESCILDMDNSTLFGHRHKDAVQDDDATMQSATIWSFK